MSYQVRTNVFEGPLDLLVQLIRRNQLDISAVGLTGVVSDYLATLGEMEEMDIEVTSEFLLLAATLIQLKARSLLPDDATLDLDEELALLEERDQLLARLLSSVTFKDVAAVLRGLMERESRFVARVSGIDPEMAAPRPDVIIGTDRLGLAARATRVFERRDPTPDLDHLDLDLPSVEDALIDLKARVEGTALATFEELTGHCRRTSEVAAYFLALLELARWGLVTISQPDWLAPIEVEATGSALVDLTSEWA